MNATKNRALLVRQAKAVCAALDMADTRATLDVVGHDRINGVLMLRLPVFGVTVGRDAVCRFSRFGATTNEAIDDCRESLRAYLTTHGLTAGIDALRRTE